MCAYTTIKSKYQSLVPVSLHVLDTPGDLMQTSRCADYYFEKPDVILICIDISLQLDENKIDVWTQYVLKQVTKHHTYFKHE